MINDIGCKDLQDRRDTHLMLLHKIVNDEVNVPLVSNSPGTHHVLFPNN